ncbi:arginase [Iocasia frigidifontis]|uniref:Arginase n=1 Tax=Iocasia fonsfrigidae TaxID=2682810 RepID=A0A8A7KKD9_9FIRM|nr:arginase [Iocasia fonsfrigidae]QTL98322.1 arginase [Iocasia fonsfrigidae]
MNNDISVLGIKVDLGIYKRGANNGPDAIRKAGLIRGLECKGYNVYDEGDWDSDVELVDYLNDFNNVSLDIRIVTKEFERLANKVKNFCTTDKFPLIIGGDHSISIATIAGISLNYNNLGIIWFDAHADLNTPDTSLSGNIYGMPLAVNLGYGYPRFLEVGYSGPKVKHKNIVLVGTRELDPGEIKFIDNHDIKVFSMKEINRKGIENVMIDVLDYLGKKCDGIHLSFDMDVLDPNYVPGVRTPCSDGVSLSDGIIAMKTIRESKLLSSAEFVEVNPKLDVNQQTARNVVKLVENLF